MISDNYVSIMVIYWLWNSNGIPRSNIRNPMLDFNNYNSASIKKGMKEILPTTMFAYLITYKISFTAV